MILIRNFIKKFRKLEISQQDWKIHVVKFEEECYMFFGGENNEGL